MATRKKINPAWLLVPVVICILVFAAITWLSSTQSYSSYTHTYSASGWEILQRLHPAFFVWVWIGTGLAVIFGILAYCNETGAGWLGKKLSGNDVLTVVLIILILICMFGPWIPAFEASGDGGATLPQEPTSQHKIYNPSNSCYAGTYIVFNCPGVYPDYTDGELSKGRQESQWIQGRSYSKEQVARMGTRTIYMVCSDNWACFRMGVDTYEYGQSMECI